jgi:glycosyltransferase involved in cell wall biosynthesis
MTDNTVNIIVKSVRTITWRQYFVFVLTIAAHFVEKFSRKHESQKYISCVSRIIETERRLLMWRYSFCTTWIPFIPAGRVDPAIRSVHQKQYLIFKLVTMDNYVHTDMLCFSHLRWFFVYQRPQHLLSRFAKDQRVFFWEEPEHDAAENDLKVQQEGNLYIITPQLKAGADVHGTQRELLDQLMNKMNIRQYHCWYYSPLAFQFTNHLEPEVTIYDCMDELSAFRFAPKELRQMETLLLNKADIVFTGGKSLFEARQHLHSNIHCFPSSIDKEHFAKARQFDEDPADQVAIPHPRIGFYGVIDERFNMDLLEQLAKQRPDWHFVILGPTAKIDPAKFPTAPNLHFPGGRSYEDLPRYLAGWDVAIMPFALNESTKYISPTKTPEYLAGGKPVVSTSIRDVVSPYGEKKLVYIADTVQEFTAAIEAALQKKYDVEWLESVDNFLENNSWDKTYSEMRQLIRETTEGKKNLTPIKQSIYV